MRDGTANDLEWNGCARAYNVGWVVSRSGMRIARGKVEGVKAAETKFLTSDKDNADEL